jgi:hypothetical protein
METEETAVARQRLGNQVTAATNTHATELLDAVFCIWYVLYQKLSM